MIDCRCKLATRKCQEPRRHAPGKQPGRHMHEYTAYVPGILYLRSVYICLEACDYRAFVSGMTNRHGHWVCWMSMDGKNSLNTQQAAAWNT